MKPRKNLPRLAKGCNRRLVQLVDSIAVARGFGDSKETEKVFGHVIIATHNLWVEFARAFFLSLKYAPRSHSGMTWYSGLSNESSCSHAIRFASTSGGSARRDEVAWHDIGLYITLLDNVLSGFSPTPEVERLKNDIMFWGQNMDKLTTVRNFYAHRNWETADKVRRMIRREYSIPVGKNDSPTVLINRVSPHSTQTIVEDWLGEVDALIVCMSV